MRDEKRWNPNSILSLQAHIDLLRIKLLYFWSSRSEYAAELLGKHRRRPRVAAALSLRFYLRHQARPPQNAEFLFYLFMSPQNCDALVGDLEERYKLIHKKFGCRRARFWYWTQALTSLGPIAWAWGKKVSMKPVLAVAAWAVAKGLVGHDSWLAAVVELVKKVRS